MGIIVYAMWLRVHVIVRGIKGLCGRSGYCRWTWSYDEVAGLIRDFGE